MVEYYHKKTNEAKVTLRGNLGVREGGGKRYILKPLLGNTQTEVGDFNWHEHQV